MNKIENVQELPLLVGIPKVGDNIVFTTDEKVQFYNAFGYKGVKIGDKLQNTRHGYTRTIEAFNGEYGMGFYYAEGVSMWDTFETFDVGRLVLVDSLEIETLRYEDLDENKVYVGKMIGDYRLFRTSCGFINGAGRKFNVGQFDYYDDLREATLDETIQFYREFGYGGVKIGDTVEFNDGDRYIVEDFSNYETAPCFRMNGGSYMVTRLDRGDFRKVSPVESTKNEIDWQAKYEELARQVAAGVLTTNQSRVTTDLPMVQTDAVEPTTENRLVKTTSYLKNLLFGV